MHRWERGGYVFWHFIHRKFSFHGLLFVLQAMFYHYGPYALQSWVIEDIFPLHLSFRRLAHPHTRSHFLHMTTRCVSVRGLISTALWLGARLFAKGTYLECDTLWFEPVTLPFIRYVIAGEHVMKFFVFDFHQQMLKAIEILASDWLRANLSVKITDKMLCETPPWCYFARASFLFVVYQNSVNSLSFFFGGGCYSIIIIFKMSPIFMFRHCSAPSN